MKSFSIRKPVSHSSPVVTLPPAKKEKEIRAKRREQRDDNAHAAAVNRAHQMFRNRG